MDKIEQEFFEAFGIEPKHIYKLENVPLEFCISYRGKCKCQKTGYIHILTAPSLQSAKEYIAFDYSHFSDKENIKCTEIKKIYPRITTKIRDTLEEILSRCGGVDYYESFNFMGTKKSGYRYYKTNRNYRLNIKEGDAKTRIGALRNILIQFKDEIQDQVKELFNGQ